MKKVILPLALLVGAAGAAHAQTGIKYGIKGGFNLSTYTGGGATGTDSGFKPGFAAGVLVNFGISDNASVQIEGLYSQKGIFLDKVNYALVNSNGSTTTYNGYQYRSTLQYIDVPVLLKYNIGEDGKGLFFEVGPQASFTVANREFLRPQGAKVNSGDEITLSENRDRLVPVGVGYVGGIGYQITSGFGLGVRYKGDFTNVYKDGFGTGSSTLPGTNNFHNGVFQVQAHYLFGGTK